MKKIIVYTFGLLLAAMATGQFASFEEFVSIISSYNVAPDSANLVALLIMGLELFGAVGILLTDKASAWRPLLTLLGVAAAVVWVALLAQALNNGLNLANTGFFGSYFPQALSANTLTQSVVVAVWSIVAFKIASDRSN